MLDPVLQATPSTSGNDFLALLYFAAAGLITLGIDLLRRYGQHRMSLWESKHPLPEDEDDD